MSKFLRIAVLPPTGRAGQVTSYPWGRDGLAQAIQRAQPGEVVAIGVYTNHDGLDEHVADYDAITGKEIT